MSTDTRTQILALGERWAQAERTADTGALDEIAVADFRLVGPFGFILDKTQWLDRYRSGSFETRSLTWDEVDVREFGASAIAIGRHVQEAAYQGQPADGQFRATHVLVRDGGQWKLAGMHLSQLGLPGGAPSSQAALSTS